MPPGGSGNLKMIPSMSLHAVKGSEWVDHVIISLGSHLLTVIFQWRPWLVDWRYYLFYIWSYVGFGGVRKGIRPNVTMLQNLLFWGFSCKHVQTLINWILRSTGRTDLKQFWWCGCWWWCRGWWWWWRGSKVSAYTGSDCIQRGCKLRHLSLLLFCEKVNHSCHWFYETTQIK